MFTFYQAILDQRSINKGCRTTAILQAQKGGDTDLKHLDPGNIDSRAKESQNHNFQEPCLNTELAKRYYEKKIYYPEILDFILKFRNSFLEASGSVKPELKSQASAEGPVISFMTHDKLTPLLKRRHESQILNNVQTLLPKFSSKVKVEILALSVDCDVLRSLSLYVDPNCNEPDINPILKRYPKHKKIIQRFQDHMDDVKNSVQVVTILYSLVDNTYQVLL